MKRRHFVALTSLAGAMLPALTLAATPCPPPDIAVDGGTTVTTACDDGQDDGPDAVHRRVVARHELKRYTNEAT